MESSPGSWVLNSIIWDSDENFWDLYSSIVNKSLMPRKRERGANCKNNK